MSMGQAPDVFKCGISGLVVADMKMQLTSASGDTAGNESGVKYWLKVVGAESTSSIPGIASPVSYAEKIKGPIMMYAGVDDIRTPLEQTRAAQSALERAGNRPKAMVSRPKRAMVLASSKTTSIFTTRYSSFLKSTSAASVSS